MTSEILYATVGGASVGGALLLRAKFHAWVESIETEAVARYRKLHPTPVVTPQLMADVTLKTFLPTLAEMSKIQVATAKRLETVEAAVKAIRPATSPQLVVNRIENVAQVAHGAAQAEPEPFRWRKDPGMMAIARDVAQGLVGSSVRMPKAEAEARINAIMDRQTGPGITFDEIFKEAFKK